MYKHVKDDEQGKQNTKTCRDGKKKQLNDKICNNEQNKPKNKRRKQLKQLGDAARQREDKLYNRKTSEAYELPK